MGNVLLIIRYAIAATACLTLAACFGGPPDPADIKPVYRVLNSPRPVPSPRWNPRRGYGSVQKAARPQSARPQPARPAASQTTQRPTATASTAPPKATQPSAAIRTSSTTITVKKGDTLYSLARKHGVPVRSLIAANGVAPPYALAIGQKLRLPTSLTHTVRRGDTGYGISRRYGVNLAALMRVNNIRKPYRLAVGQILKLPGGAQRVVTTASANTTAPARARSVPLPAPPARSKSGFRWPVEGALASRFGPKEGGLHNDGINIVAQQGTPVRSAEAGVVVYASNALEGYGNLLLLKHADGWLTAYAHNERLLVNKGDRIEKGQVIARVGATGGVTEPQLHFEIRKGRRALDPLDYLQGRTASAR